jgi:hypothetical protein
MTSPSSSHGSFGALSSFTDNLADRVRSLVTAVCAEPDVKAAVEANHDDNQWWPRYVADWRIRMLVAGWSTRVSYAMIDTYASIVKTADTTGWDRLTNMTDAQVAELVRPLGLTRARISYLRSLETFLEGLGPDDPDPLESPARDFIATFAAGVDSASFKVAQCATLYARGYHSGIIPVDSGMVTKLAPVFGMVLEKGPQSHERMRLLLESCANADAAGYRELIDQHRYQVKLPDDTPPT